jgi:hypothetical protein
MWDGINRVVQVLSPIVSVLRMADADIPCTGLVYQQMSELEKILSKVVLDDNPQKSRQLVRELKDCLADRWAYLHNDFYAAAYALNPAFLEHDLSECDAEIMSGFNAVLLKFAGGDEHVYSTMNFEFESFRRFEGPGKSSGESMLPHHWWFAYSSEWPTLSPVAMKVLAQCPSSSASERNWSSYDHVVSKDRNRLTPDRAMKLVHCYHNLRSLKLLAEAQEAGKRGKRGSVMLDRLLVEVEEAEELFQQEMTEEVVQEGASVPQDTHARPGHARRSVVDELDLEDEDMRQFFY